MKRILTSLIAVCLIISALASFTACEHKCEYSTAWTTDDNEHWHICNDAECTLVADKAVHTWDEGKITAEATQEADGVKTFTCTVCQKTRTEKVEFTGLSREAWNGVITADTFKNVTFTQTAVMKAMGITVETTVTYIIADDGMMIKMEAAGESNEVVCPEGELENSKKEFVNVVQDMCDFDSFKYDPKSKTYVSTKTIKLSLLDMESSETVLRFEDGKPVEYIAKGNTVIENIKYDVEVTYTFTDYGTTEIPNKTENV